MIRSSFTRLVRAPAAVQAIPRWTPQVTSRVGALAVVFGALLLAAGCQTDKLSKKKATEAAQYNAQLGANYLQRGDLEQARRKLESALGQDQDNAMAHVVYGQLQQRVGRPDVARGHFERAIEIEPDVAEHRNAYGIFLCSVDEVSAAEAEFEKAAEDPYYSTPEYALDNAGLCMLDAKDLDGAEKYLRAALRENTKFPAAWLHMAQLHKERQRLTVAAAYLQNYEKLGPRTPESLLLGHEIKRDAGDLGAAERYASQLLNDFPASREAGAYLARPLN